MELWIGQFRGELAALGAAFLWAIAAIIYTRLGTRITPLILNLSKGLVAMALLLLVLGLQGGLFPAVNSLTLSLLLLSGLVGIGLGDTCYFQALNHLGPQRTLLIEMLSPPMSALLALVFLQEILSPRNWLGILLTVGGVAWVISERSPTHTKTPALSLAGLGFALLADVSQAVGAVLSRTALSTSVADPLWSTLVRLVGGTIIILPLLAWQRGHGVPMTNPLRSRRLLGAIAITAFFSTFLGIWLQQTSLKFAATGVAQALNATSPLFMLPLSVILGETLTLRAILGVFLALGGIWLLFG